MSKQIRATVDAWITGGRGVTDLPDDNAAAVSIVEYYHQDMSSSGWLKVGTADITVTFDDDAEILKTQVALLREAKEKLIKEATIKAEKIEERIQSLLCLEAPKREVDDDLPF